MAKGIAFPFWDSVANLDELEQFVGPLWGFHVYFHGHTKKEAIRNLLMSARDQCLFKDEQLAAVRKIIEELPKGHRIEGHVEGDATELMLHIQVSGKGNQGIFSDDKLGHAEEEQSLWAEDFGRSPAEKHMCPEDAKPCNERGCRWCPYDVY